MAEPLPLTPDELMRAYVAALTYGIDMDTDDDMSTVSQHLNLNEHSFYLSLYITRPFLEDPIFAALSIGDRPIVIRGKAAIGKTSLIRHLLRRLRTTYNTSSVHIDCKYLAFALNSTRGHSLDNTPAARLHEDITEYVRGQAKTIANACNPPDTYALAGRLLDAIESGRLAQGGASHRVSPSILPATAVILDQVAAANRLVNNTQCTPSQWIRSELGRGNTRVAYMISKFVMRLPLRELFLLTRLPNIKTGKTVLVLDNVDAIQHYAHRHAFWEWVKDVARDLSDTAVVVYVTRNESIVQSHETNAGDLRIKTFSLDTMIRELTVAQMLSLAESDRSSELSGRNELTFEQKLVDARLAFIKRQLAHNRTSDQSKVASIAHIYAATRNLPRVRETVDALANWNGRALCVNVCNFARTVADLLPHSWATQERITAEEELKLETLYYCWLTGSLLHDPMPAYCELANPAEWYFGGQISGSSVNQGSIYNFRRYLVMAAANVLTKRSSGTGEVSVETIMEWVSEIGLSRDDIRVVIHELIVELGLPRGNYLSPCNNYVGLYSAISVTELPQAVFVTDRGLQLSRHTCLRFHYILGMLRHSGVINCNMHGIARDGRGLAVNTELLNIARRAFRDVSRRCVEHLREVRKLLWSRYREAWLDRYCTHFGVIDTERSHNGRRRQYTHCEEALRSASMYVSSLQATGALGGVSEIAEDFRRLHAELSNYLDDRMRCEYEESPLQWPEWLRPRSH